MGLILAVLVGGADGDQGVAAGSSTIFEDVAKASGLDFVYFNGMTGRHFIPEVTGQGAALLDFDNDGDLDVYMVQGGLFDPAVTMKDAFFPVASEKTLVDRLYRNDSKNGVLRFTDVTAASGIVDAEYGMGVAAADYDNDGYTDLYVSNMGRNHLFHNNGDGTFSDVTTKAGVDDARWSTSTAWWDYDRDGWLDLYVANYIDFKTTIEVNCYAKSSAPDFCGPDAYPSVGDSLFRNRGDGTFENVTAKVGMGKATGAGLGVVAADFNGDAWLDLYVANDGDANQLWINGKDGTFSDEALWAGAALNGEGAPEASMGVDAGDYDNDGDEDLFMAHIMEETNTLYVNDGKGFFEDRTITSGLSGMSLGFTGFGAAFIDFDNDGWLDLIVVNGAVRIIEERVKAGDTFPCGQPNFLLRNNGKGKFEDVTAAAGETFRFIEVSRGAVLGDVDNDGDTDVLLANNTGPSRLLVNQVGNANHWLGLRLLGGTPGRDALGSRVVVETGKGPRLGRRVRSDGSFCSSNDPRVLVGLGEAATVSSVTVQWASGSTEVWRNLEVDRYHTLREGTAPKEKKGR